ncbi:ComF family protein [Vibrio ziniensis]|uniref:ComF family protein n=1 Tax=Vibrio ziniensis TaxID=2711221 RepID=A0A6G7CEU6_9VIBR|nr:ComF family protein [Vibrio ziniensis]QIH40593.1 ComF family protein [Vibrio ziniensis]
MLSDWFQKANFIHRCLAPQCPICKLALDNKLPYAVCSACEAWYPKYPRCQCCGLATLTPVDMCGQCLTKPTIWHNLYCVGDYQFPLSNIIHLLKYQRQFWQAKPLAKRLSECIETPAPVITSVPLHWHRYLRRGFNQSDLIAKHLAAFLNVDYQPRLFSRVLDTKSQQALSKVQRKHNLANAFRLNRRPKCKHVAIVDDVVTTGSTVLHLCQLLLEVGVERIDIYCICRTPEPEDNS